MRCNGGATLGIPSGIGVLAKVPSGTKPVIRKLGAATLFLLQLRISNFDDTLRRQKALGDRVVVQNQMSHSELAIYVDENLGF